MSEVFEVRFSNAIEGAVTRRKQQLEDLQAHAEAAFSPSFQALQIAAQKLLAFSEPPGTVSAIEGPAFSSDFRFVVYSANLTLSYRDAERTLRFSYHFQDPKPLSVTGLDASAVDIALGPEAHGIGAGSSAHAKLGTAPLRLIDAQGVHLGLAVEDLLIRFFTTD